jgi:glyoxylase-like metal-dependent hydrolase (beta-lactamase superfamily II)/rhodanese-related sulfurtransferase
MDIQAIRTTGLGDATYLLTHEGASLLVDPQRDIGRFEDALAASGGSLEMVVETHLHNDYVSGGPDIARKTGACLVLPAAAAPAYRSTPAFHNEDLDVGPFVVRPIHTPGHTPEHMSYLVLVDGEPLVVFSGGSLLVGSAGRPDLLGEERADTLARLQYISVHRLAALPDDVQLMPTHGEGSFCTASGAGRNTSTIGVERASNPVLAYPDEDAFVKGQLAELQPYPAYYQHMGPANLYGYPARATADVPLLSVAELAETQATIIDIRPKQEYADSHIPGSIGLETRDQVGVWAGWLLPHDSEVVILANHDQDVGEVLAQFIRIGMDGVVGLHYGIGDWMAAGHPITTNRTVDVEGFLAALVEDPDLQILDVRAPNEYEAGNLPGSIWSYLPDLAAELPAELDRDRPVWVTCGTGYRATAAVRWLEAAGFRSVVLIGGGVPEILQALAV